MENSHRLNIALFRKGNDRGKKQDPDSMEDQVKDALKDLENQIKTGRIKG